MKLRSAKKVWDRQSIYRETTRRKARSRVLRWLRKAFPSRHDFALAE
jgi:hypothetical protein